MPEHTVKKTAIEIDGKKFIQVETIYITLIPEEEILDKKVKLEEKYEKEHKDLEDLENQLKSFKSKK